MHWVPRALFVAFFVTFFTDVLFNLTEGTPLIWKEIGISFGIFLIGFLIWSKLLDYFEKRKRRKESTSQ